MIVGARKGPRIHDLRVFTMTLHKYSASDFTLVQNRFLDEYMVSANGEFVKVYLYLLRSSSADREISLSSIADALNHTEGDVKRALSYWQRKNLLRLAFDEKGNLSDIILNDEPEAVAQHDRVRTYAAHMQEATEPIRISVSAARKKELSQQEDICQLMYIAQQYLGRPLSNSEITHILYFYDELHFSADLIEYLIEYCVSKNKTSIHYIRTVALEWARKGVTTVEEAKKDTMLYKKEYYAVLNAFGIKNRGPAQSECEWMEKWFDEMGFSKAIVLEACKRTIDRTHEPSFPYTDKILTSWKQAGVKKRSDIDALDEKPAAVPVKKTASATRSASTNRFNNFPQRKYDYEQLEKELLDY